MIEILGRKVVPEVELPSAFRRISEVAEAVDETWNRHRFPTLEAIVATVVPREPAHQTLGKTRARSPSFFGRLCEEGQTWVCQHHDPTYVAIRDRNIAERNFVGRYVNDQTELIRFGQCAFGSTTIGTVNPPFAKLVGDAAVFGRR